MPGLPLMPPLSARTLLRPATVAALSGLVAASSGCLENSDEREAKLPRNAVAAVDGAPIERARLARWLRASSIEQRFGEDRVVPDPPRFTSCAARMRRRARRLSAGAARARCAREYRILRDEVARFLIVAEWVRQEARRRSLAVNRGELRSAFAAERARAFGARRRGGPRRGVGERRYRRFLAATGLRPRDVLFRLETAMLERELAEDVQRSASRPSPRAVDAYYARHRRAFRGRSLEEVRAPIQQRLRAHTERRAFADFIPRFRRSYRAKTTCARDITVPECPDSSKR